MVVAYRAIRSDTDFQECCRAALITVLGNPGTDVDTFTNDKAGIQHEWRQTACVTVAPGGCDRWSNSCLVS